MKVLPSSIRALVPNRGYGSKKHTSASDVCIVTSNRQCWVSSVLSLRTAYKMIDDARKWLLFALLYTANIAFNDEVLAK